MALPTANDVHVDQMLTNVSIAYKNETYIADQIFPMLPVKKQSDIIPSYDKSFWFRDEAKLAMPGTDIAISEYAVTTTDTYYCPRHRVGKIITDEQRENADVPFDLDSEAVTFVTDKLLLRRELQFVTKMFTTSVWTTDVTGGTNFTVWSNYAGSSPLTDVETAKETIEGSIARAPNTMVIGSQVYTQLRNHPDLLDSIKYTQRAMLTPDLISSLLEMKLLVGRAIYTGDPAGVAEASISYSRVWGKHGLALYVPPGPSLMAPAAGYTVVWNRVANAPQYIQRFRRQEQESDLVVGNSYFVHKQTSANAGYFFSGAVS